MVACGVVSEGHPRDLLRFCSVIIVSFSKAVNLTALGKPFLQLVYLDDKCLLNGK